MASIEVQAFSLQDFCNSYFNKSEKIYDLFSFFVSLNTTPMSCYMAVFVSLLSECCTH